ncbi:nuclear pore complex protein Nup107 [Bradysia coprophila]|uniref:nuclear pore complex protein Nup107 n=1 Tax=Bradysia coprophila TaxID=38358 RepID=UPI00187D7FC7|nr:nuclear pore complex protein Nup107 [Bradysia coprophila]
MNSTFDSPKFGLIRNMDNRGMPKGDMSMNMSTSDMRRFLNNSNETTSYKHSVMDETATDVLTTKQKTNSLYGHFLEILQSRTNDSEVFETVQDLIAACSDTIDEIEKFQRHGQHTNRQEYNWLNQERNTWRLLYALYQDRLITQKEAMDYDDAPLMGSEKMIVENLYRNNANLREYQLIVDWLEQCADEKEIPQIGLYTDQTISWENTLHQLQNKDRPLFGRGREIVKSMDPDAMIRERLPLHDLDMEDEARLSKQILIEMRKGQIENAQSLCTHCGQSWRAALLEGWRLHHDPNYDQSNTDTKLAVEGNPHRDLWKKLAWMMAENKNLDEYTRANVGILCGHLESVLLPLGQSWVDLLWGYLKTQIDIRVEGEIRSCSTKSHLDMPEKYWNGKMSLEQIFEELSAHKSDTIRVAAENPVNIVQKFLILDDIPELMRHIDAWISADKIGPQMLRFLTHVVLFMRQIGRPHHEDVADRVIKAYVECLIELGERQSVAFYTVAVPNEVQLVLYSKYLQTIHGTDERKLALEEANNVGLDIQAITCYTVESIRNEQLNENEQKQLCSYIGEGDLNKISALEWLTFYQEQRGELLWQANSMIRSFLAENKIECVRNTFKIVPQDSIQQIVANYGSRDNLPYKEECSIKEYLCHQTYLKAIDGYNDWTKLYHSKPKEPQSLAANANFTDKVAAEHKEQIYKSELERWNINLIDQTKTARDLLFAVLQFPENYLVDPDAEKMLDDDEHYSWSHRSIQLESLRKLCIPEVVLLLHKVLHLAGEYKECVRLADELANESRQLYKVYSKHKLAELIGKISESSLALMNAKMDPWGYTIDV